MITIKRTVAGLALSLAAINTAHAFATSRDFPELEAQKAPGKLSKLLNEMPVLTPDTLDECGAEQIRSLTHALEDMSRKARAQVVAALRARGIHSIEFKDTSPLDHRRLIGEKIICMGKPKTGYWEDDINWTSRRWRDLYPDTVSYDQLRFEGQSYGAAERLPKNGFRGPDGSLLHNVENAILERARKLQNESQLSGGLLAITPRSQKYILHRAEYLVRPVAWAKLYHEDGQFQAFLSHLRAGEIDLKESVWTTEDEPYRQACARPLKLGDLMRTSDERTDQEQ
jgi:hypothetical protein